MAITKLRRTVRGAMMPAIKTGSPVMISYKDMLAAANAVVPRLTPASRRR